MRTKSAEYLKQVEKRKEEDFHEAYEKVKKENEELKAEMKKKDALVNSLFKLEQELYLKRLESGMLTPPPSDPGDGSNQSNLSNEALGDQTIIIPTDAESIKPKGLRKKVSINLDEMPDLDDEEVSI
eukprot:UN31879